MLNRMASKNTHFMTRRVAALITTLATTLATALGFVIFTGGTAFASGQNCKSAGDYGHGGTGSDGTICITVFGSSNVIDTITGSAGVNGYASIFGSSAHVQVTDPTGRTLCNSPEQGLTDAGETVVCHWDGGGVAHGTGQYCTTLWIYNAALNAYYNDGTECLNVFIS